MQDFFRRGWTRFPHDPVLAAWLDAAAPAAWRAVADPANANWLRCKGTWFAGVNVLANDEAGAVAGSGPLRGRAVDFIEHRLGLRGLRWDAGQVSVVYPGYPRPREGESEAAFRYRRDRDAAHVDGLHPVGPDRRRMLRERHAFVLGLPVNPAGQGASPMVVWEGSHEVMRAAFREALDEVPAKRWAEVDLTGVYVAARRRVFESCARVEVTAGPGEAYVIHRLALHGVSPWEARAGKHPEGRAVIYFRPAMLGPIRRWIEDD